MTRLHRPTRRQFVCAAAAAAGTALLPNAVLAGPAQDAAPSVAATIPQPVSREKIPWKVEPFPLRQVRLRKGPFLDALQADQRYLHLLPSERLLHTFRLNAGLSSSAEPLGGWEKPDCELRGHFAGGHYLSACALMYCECRGSRVERKSGWVGRADG